MNNCFNGKYQPQIKVILTYRVSFIAMLDIIIAISMIETRLTTFIKMKFNLSDDQTNIDILKYRVAANNTDYHIILKLILQRIIITNFCDQESHLRLSTISDLESPSNFQVKEKKIIQIGPETRKLDICGQRVI